MDAEFQLLIDNTLSVSAQVNEYIKYAGEIAETGRLIDEKALRHPIKMNTFIDGALNEFRNTRSLSQTLSVEYDVTENIAAFILQELEKNSPVGFGEDKHPGQYKSSHVLFADGVLVTDSGNPPSAHEYLFVSRVPYSQKIETGESDQAPHGVYELTANISQKMFPNTNIMFIEWPGMFGIAAHKRTSKAQNRYPAIQVTF